MSDHTDTAQDITISEKAVREIGKIRDENSIPENFALRIGVKGGGCSGLSYSLGFDSDIKDTDETLDIAGVKLVIDAKSLYYLDGTELD